MARSCLYFHFRRVPVVSPVLRDSNQDVVLLDSGADEPRGDGLVHPLLLFRSVPVGQQELDEHDVCSFSVRERLRIGLSGKNITPHTLRHTCAMTLLHAGIDTASIALWLGHATIQTTQAYLHADLELKRRTLERVPPIDERPPARYQASDALIAFLANR